MAEPEPRSLFDMPVDEVADVLLDAEAISDLDAGNGVPHERVAEWLKRLLKGEKAAPPID